MSHRFALMVFHFCIPIHAIANNKAESVTALFKFLTSVLGVFANTFAGFLSDVLGRKTVLLIVFTIPYLALFSVWSSSLIVAICLLIYNHFPVITCYPFLVSLSLTMLVDNNILINSYIVDITEDDVFLPDQFWYIEVASQEGLPDDCDYLCRFCHWSFCVLLGYRCHLLYC